MSTFDEMLKTLTKVIKQANRTKTQAYDVAATVTRVEGDIAWVHIPGGVQETPVKLTVAAKPGQTVQVRVSGGRAFLVGNASAPPTDDATAYKAIRRVEATNQVVAQNKADIAETAERVSGAYQAITELNETAVTGVVVQYAKGTSPTEPPTSGWSSDSPTWEDGKYIWQRTVTTIDGEQIVSNVACIQGARGADGTSVSILGSYNTLAELQAAHPTGSEGDAYMVGTNLYVWNGSEWYDVGRIQGPQGEQGQRGKGVSSLQAQYYLSTSSSTTEGGSWSTTPQTYVNGRYYWTRTRVTWTDNTTTYTTAVLDNGLTNANSNAYQALRTAGNAEDIAEATAQYFWTDTDGVHVASEPELPTATRNTLWNALGMLFRKGANNLLAILTGASPGVAIYDGKGNEDSNVIAKFGADGVRVGKTSASYVNISKQEIKQNLMGHDVFSVKYLNDPDTGLCDFHFIFYDSLNPVDEIQQSNYIYTTAYPPTASKPREFAWPPFVDGTIQAVDKNGNQLTVVSGESEFEGQWWGISGGVDESMLPITVTYKTAEVFADMTFASDNGNAYFNADAFYVRIDTSYSGDDSWDSGLYESLETLGWEDEVLE